MREVKYTSCFKRDYRREQSGQLGKKLDAPPEDTLKGVRALLATLLDE
jgi:hypothetical protein